MHSYTRIIIGCGQSAGRLQQLKSNSTSVKVNHARLLGEDYYYLMAVSPDVCGSVLLTGLVKWFSLERCPFCHPTITITSLQGTRQSYPDIAF